jgi:hypothetical protein
MNRTEKIAISSVIMCLIFFSSFVPVFADEHDCSKEVGKNVSFTIFDDIGMPDGSPSSKPYTSNDAQTNVTSHEAYNVTLDLSVNLKFNDVETWVLEVATPISLLTLILAIISQSLQIAEQVMEGLFTPMGVLIIIVATEILVFLKELRNNRPRDYNGMSCGLQKALILT